MSDIIPAPRAPGINKAWEDLDARGTMYGVFAQEGCSPDPIAIFRDEDEADRWLKWRTTEGAEDDRLPTDFYTVCPVRRLQGITWNSYEPPPPHENTPTLEQVEAIERH
jgi:hypothetical protein